MSLNKAMLRREHVYRASLQAGDRRVALDAAMDRCKLMGHYPSAECKVKLDGNMALTGKDGGPIQQIVVYLPDNARDHQPQEAMDAGHPDAKPGTGPEAAEGTAGEVPGQPG